MPLLAGPTVDLCTVCGGPRPPRARAYCARCKTEQRRRKVAANTAAMRARQPATAHGDDDDILTPTRRLIELLGYLRKHRHLRAPAVPTSKIKTNVACYRDASDDTLERDLAILEARGLVATGITDSYLCRHHDGVRLIEQVKPPAYELTQPEHAAISAARAAIRPGAIAPALPDGPTDRRADRLDLHMRLLRAVEEHHDEMPLDELVSLLGATRPRVIEALRNIDELRGTGLFPGLTVVYDDRDHDDRASDRGDDIDAVTIIRSAERPRRNPTLGLGLDELGRFAYTQAECDDRLDLIDNALNAWAPNKAPHLVKPLTSARRKLAGWRRMVGRPDTARGSSAGKPPAP